MNKKLHLIIYIAFVWLLAGCESEEVKGVMPMADMLRVGETSLDLTKDAASRTITVTSNCDWDFAVEKTANWGDLTIQKADAGLTMQTEANVGRESRQATLTISTKSGITRTVRISQTQGEVQLETQGGDNKTLTYLYSGGKQEFTITSNTTWEITGMADWLSLDKQNGTGTSKVEVTVGEIQTDVARNATLVVSAENGAKTDYIIVQQQGKAIELSVSPQALTFAATGESKQIQITCNADWTVVTADELVQLSDVSGSQSKAVTVTLPENRQPTARSSSVTIASGSNRRETVTLTQAAATPPVVGTLSLVANSVGRHEATLSFSVTSAFPVTECGLCYSEANSEPTVNDIVQLADSETLSVMLTGLEAGVTYYIRAYATSDIGTTYSDNVVTVTTLGSEPGEDDNPKPNPK